MCGLLSLYMRLINHNVRVIIHLPFRHNSLVFWHATKILSISDRKLTYASFHMSTVSININFHRTYVICIAYFGLFYLSEEYFQWQKCHTILKKQKIEFWTHCWHFENTLFLPHCFCLFLVRERNWNSFSLCLYYFLHNFFSKKNKLKIIIIVVLPVSACHHFSLNKPILQPKKWLWKE